MNRLPSIAGLAVVAVLVVAAAYEALVAFGAIELGSEPGAGPPGEGLVLLCALVAMLVGAALAMLPRGGALPLLAPAGAGFLLARFYTFDPYYLPGLRRMSDGGLLPPPLVYAVVAASLLAAVFAQRRPLVGRLFTGGVLLASALLALVAGAGH